MRCFRGLAVRHQGYSYNIAAHIAHHYGIGISKEPGVQWDIARSDISLVARGIGGFAMELTVVMLHDCEVVRRQSAFPNRQF